MRRIIGVVGLVRCCVAGPVWFVTLDRLCATGVIADSLDDVGQARARLGNRSLLRDITAGIIGIGELVAFGVSDTSQPTIAVLGVTRCAIEFVAEACDPFCGRVCDINPLSAIGVRNRRGHVGCCQGPAIRPIHTIGSDR